MTTKVCPNYCVFGVYGGGDDWKMGKPHMQDDWGFCPVCGAPARVFTEMSYEEPHSVAFADFKKEQRKRWLYWRRHGKHFNLCTKLPPVPEKPKKNRAIRRPMQSIGEDGFGRALQSRNESRAKQTAVVQGVSDRYKYSISAASHDVHIEINSGRHPLSTKQPLSVASDILAKTLLVHALKQRFIAANPAVGTDVIDWFSYVPARSTFSEGLEVMKEAYPHYEWGRRP